MNKNILILFFILFLAGFLRLYRLDQVPPSPSLDEVSLGYNAYSILKTRADEYGNRWPILLRAYDDWRPALYVYFVIPFVRIMGLSIVAVRLPAVIFSLITILTTYFLAKRIFRDSLYGLLAAGLLAISPWHIYLSRLGHEVGMGLAFLILGLLFFLKYFWSWSAVFFVLALYSYQSQKIFVPFLIFLLIIIFWLEVKKRKKTMLWSGVLAFLMLIPLLVATFSPGGLTRAKGTLIIGNPFEGDYMAFDRVVRDRQNGNWLGTVFDSRPLAKGMFILRAYFSHFDPTWLYFYKIDEIHKISNLGLFFPWEVPLFLIGVYQLIGLTIPHKFKYLVLTWLIFAPLPAAITTQTPHAMRALSMLPMIQIIEAVGAVFLGKKFFSGFSSKVIMVGLSGVLLVVSLGYLIHNYFQNFPHEQSASFQYPLSQAIKYVLSIQDKYEKVIFSRNGQLDQSYMFFLYFSQTDPAWYQKQGGTLSGGFAEDHYFGKYEFRNIDWNREFLKPQTNKTLYIGNILKENSDFLEESNQLRVFKLLSGQEAIEVVAR